MIIQMLDLKQYKKLLQITCPQCQPSTGEFLFEVRFEQPYPHSVFKYEVKKLHSEIVQLYKMLEEQIFQFDNPFGGNFIDKLKQSQSDMVRVNSALKECLGRIDVITNRTFVQFFCIHLHYDDFADGLKEEEMKGKEKGKIEEEEKGKKKESQFEGMISMAREISSCRLQLMKQSEILDFTYVKYEDTELLYILEQPKKTTKIKNFFKSMFSQVAKEQGFLSVHKKVKNKYVKTSMLELLAQPISMQYIAKTNLLLVTTSVGVYIYLPKLETKFQQIEVLSFVELLGCVDCANSAMRGQLYLISKLASTGRGQLYVYGINSEKLMKTQYKYDDPQSICFQELHNRLFISDSQGVHIYNVVQFLEIQKKNLVKIQHCFTNLIVNHGFLLGLAQKGFLTALELKPPGKEGLISVTTNVNLPEGVKGIVGSTKNRRLIITYYKQCIVFIDTIEGPIFSLKIHQNDQIQSLFSNKEMGQVIALGRDGHLSISELSELII